MSTIAFSLGWSLIFFSAVAMVFGPEKNLGSIKPYT